MKLNEIEYCLSNMLLIERRFNKIVKEESIFTGESISEDLENFCSKLKILFESKQLSEKGCKIAKEVMSTLESHLIAIKIVN